MAYSVDKKLVVNYPPEELESFIVHAYEYIDNLHFLLSPEIFLDNAEVYISIAKEQFLNAGWDGDGEIKLLWVPPFCMETETTMWEYTQGGLFGILSKRVMVFLGC